MADRFSTTRSVARKEFRGFFATPAAYLFLGAFLAVTLFVFFWIETFFARNIADVRPLFQWLPLLLIFLVAALVMPGLVGRAQGRHPGKPAHRTGQFTAIDTRQVRRRPGIGGPGACPDPATAGDGLPAGAIGLGSGGRRLYRNAVSGGGLRGHRPLHEWPHRQSHRRPDPHHHGLWTLLSDRL